jgi:preprotein translocase subunit YajC
MPGASTPVSVTPGGATPANGGTGAPTGPGAGGGQMMFLLPLVALMVVMIGMSMWTGRKEKKKRAELMSQIKRGDKVQTFGGIIGTISELGDDDVVLRVEEGRIRFARSAIQGVVSSSRGAAQSIEAKDSKVAAPV